MSSSGQQFNNSNNAQSQNTNNNMLDDYEDDPSLTQNTSSNFNNQTSNINNQNTNHAAESTYYPFAGYHGEGEVNDPDANYHGEDEENDQDDDNLAEIEEHLQNAQLNSNDDDYELFSDDVQRAFENYENENSRRWQRSDSQDIMFEEMRECMFYMTQEYCTAEMPTELVEITQKSDLNPNAVEFCPSYRIPPTTTTTTSSDTIPIIVMSWTPCVAQKAEGNADEQEQE
ncbi:hypothetical protein I4U23_000804 [Adineta vaga]|nr:hypothetical protein I4U23_000804 [Adineta vaga]